jgi:hypothetical protein
LEIAESALLEGKEAFMEILLMIVGVIMIAGLFTIPLRLIFRKWKDSTIGYLSGFLIGVFTVIVSGEAINVFFPIRILTITIIIGSLIWGVLILIRKMKRGVSKEPEKSTTTQDYVICPKCKLEQWSGYTVCQKCNTPLKKS